MAQVKRIALTTAGVGLLALAGLANYNTDWLYADGWRIFVGLPGGARYSFAIWWLMPGLPLALGLIALTQRNFRHALGAPFRKMGIALPLLAVGLFLMAALFPWEFSWKRPSRSGITLYLTLGSCGFALLMAGGYRFMSGLERPARQIHNWLMRLPVRSFLVLVSGLMLLVTNLISWLVFNHIPHIGDSVAQLFQARIFAAGKLFLTAPAFPDFFDWGPIIIDGRWYATYPFLHSLLLALGVLAGIPWIINPLLGTLFVVVLYYLGRDLYDEHTGRQAALLGCLTPFVFNMSSEFMNHSSSLLFATLYLLFLFRAFPIRDAAEAQGRSVSAFLAGLALGLVFCVRPYTAVLLGVPFGLFVLVRASREPVTGSGRAGLLLLGFLLSASLLLIYNQLTNDSPWRFGYVVKYGPGHEVGFHKSGWGVQHTPLRGLVNTGHDLNLLNKFLFEWPIPSLLPAAILFACGTRDLRDWLLLSSYLALVVGYFFYWFHGIAFGARFLYEAAPALILLTVRGLQMTGLFLRRLFRLNLTDGQVLGIVQRSLAVCLLMMMCAGLPPLFRMYNTYWGVDARLLQRVRAQGLGNAVVFCQELGDAFNANRLTLDGEVVYAKDLGVLNPALGIRYPGRSSYWGGKEELVALGRLEYQGSVLARAVDSFADFLAVSGTGGYRSLIFPFRELAPEGVALPEVVTDFGQVTREIIAHRKQLEDYVPALACWVANDPRALIAEFSHLDKSAHFVAGKLRFRRIWISADSLAMVFDIRRAGG